MATEETALLEKKLAYQRRHVWDHLDAGQREAALSLAEPYKAFLGQAKTEREAVRLIHSQARQYGFRAPGEAEKSRKLMFSFMNKAAALAVLGRRPLAEGLRLAVCHIDAPRLDLKLHPLYEEAELALLKTHYYGGVKKYQWLSRPLALHGRVIRADGEILDLALGEGVDEPVFTIADLLPHLAAKVQADKKVSEAFSGEKLNLIAASLPLDDQEATERFKLALLSLLHQRYGLTEEDFLAAEFEAVPAGPARDVGLDAGLVGGYAQDDRASAFAMLHAICGVEEPEYTSVALFLDKEEIGSEGATGAKAHILDHLAADLIGAAGGRPTWNEARLILKNTQAISADGTAALDPDYPEVHEKMNAALMGHGPCVNKYTGHRGKYNASDASAEYMAWFRNLLNRERVVWQAGVMGRVDEGGGGTVAKHLGEYGMEILDFGLPILDMHSPFEISSKLDMYMFARALTAFYTK